MTPADWPGRLIAVDVEDNRQSPIDLVEMAILPIRAGQADSDTAWQSLVRPPWPVSRFATRVHGLTDRDFSAAPEWPEIAGQVRELLDGVWIADHNARVEYAALDRHLPGWQPAGVTGTLKLARRAVPGRSSHGLDDVLDRAGIAISGIAGQRPWAALDAQAAALLLITLAARYPGWDSLTADAVPGGLPGTPGPAAREQRALW